MSALGSDLSQRLTHPSLARIRLVRRAHRWLDRRFAVVLILPGFIWMAALLVYPVALNIYYSFTNKSLQFPDVRWVGFDNYRYLLHDRDFRDAARRTVIWTTFSMAGQLGAGLFAALAVERLARGKPAVRLMLIVPWMFSPIVMAAVWRLMLDPLNGVANALLVSLGIVNDPVAFFGSTETAFWSTIVMTIWFGFPFVFLTIMAGLATVSRELYEAASVDGAGYWRQVWHVALPSLRPVVGTLVILRTIWLMNNFAFIFLATGGGPRDSSTTLPVYAFREGWLQFNVGRMAAISVLMSVAVLALVLGLIRVLPLASEPD